MYDLLDLYARPFQPKEPVVCLDEKSKQLLKQSRAPLPIKPGKTLKEDHEYIRSGTCNLFVAVEPKGGRRTVTVTDHRTKIDFVTFVLWLLEQVYPTAHHIHLVMDNLNTHFRKCFDEVLGVKKAQALLRRVVFHYTPKHASWLNMAEIEIGILDRQCLDRRLPDRTTLTAEVNAWQQRRNTEQRGIEWTFTRQDADKKMARHYIS
jgi:DDE superfamily endonuclease